MSQCFINGHHMKNVGSSSYCGKAMSCSKLPKLVEFDSPVFLMKLEINGKVKKATTC